MQLNVGDGQGYHHLSRHREERNQRVLVMQRVLVNLFLIILSHIDFEVQSFNLSLAFSSGEALQCT